MLDSASAVVDANAVYALGSSRAETDRLRQQSDELASESTALLDRVALRPGHWALDLGCGPRGILDLLARRVSPGGHVVGVDADPVHVAAASEFAEDLGPRSVEIVRADARDTGLREASFDLVHARALLINIPDPGEVVAEMVRLVRPGGWVASLEPDPNLWLCHPPHPAVERLYDLFRTAHTRNGSQWEVGRRLSELYRDAGLEHVSIEARAGLYTADHSRATIIPDLMRALRPSVLEMGLAGEQELDRLDAAARAHLAKPDTLTIPHLNFIAWGRKPAAVL